MNIFICEDNESQREKIKNIILDTIMIENLDMEIVLDTANPKEVLEIIEEYSKNNIYFLDVDLRDAINGIQLAEKIRDKDPRGFIVFITTHAEMSYLTFLYKVEAIDYIEKDNYKNNRRRVYDCLMNINKKYSALNNSVSKTIAVKNGEKIYNLELDSILFFETSTVIHKVNVYTENRMLEFYAQMKDVEEMLDERFIRCHRSYLVNKDKIKFVDYNLREVHMIDNSICYASVRGMKLLRELRK